MDGIFVDAALDILCQSAIGQVPQRIINSRIEDQIGLPIEGEGNQLGHLVVQLARDVARDFPAGFRVAAAVVSW